MFSKVAIISTLALALSVAAAPHSDEYNCNTGDIQCCNSVHQSNTAEAISLAALIGVAAQGLTGSVGQDCSPIGALAITGGANCAQQPVCCKNNQMNALVVVGCSPININL